MERMSKPAVQGFAAFCAVSVIEFCKCNDFGFRHSMYTFTFNCIKWFPSRAFLQWIDL